MSAGNKVQLFTQDTGNFCCFPTTTYNPVPEGLYVKKEEEYNALLELHDKEKAFQAEKEQFNKYKEQEISLINGKGNEIRKEKVKLDQEKEQFKQEKANYVKKGEATFDDLLEDEKQKLTEDAVLNSKVDGSKYSWRDIFNQIKECTLDINLLKFEFLKRKHKRFKELGNHYDSEEQLKQLDKAITLHNKSIEGIDIILNEKNEEIELSQDIVEKIKNANESEDPDKRAVLCLYNKDIKQFVKVAVTDINLAQIDNYGVALVLPNGLLAE